MKDEKKLRINDIYQSLHGHLVSPNFTPQKAVELYCFVNKKWGAIEYDGNGHNPIVIIKDQYK
tara:strand:- start:73 stop:261 length:189 start_codon:yes stop_codon:yes gene_type:complete